MAVVFRAESTFDRHVVVSNPAFHFVALKCCSDIPLRDQLWMGALKAGSRMRWMDMFSAEEAHVDPAALLILRTEQDVRAMLPLVSNLFSTLDAEP